MYGTTRGQAAATGHALLVHVLLMNGADASVATGKVRVALGFAAML